MITTEHTILEGTILLLFFSFSLYTSMMQLADMEYVHYNKVYVNKI